MIGQEYKLLTAQEYKGSCSGGDQDMDVTTIVYNSYYQVSIYLFATFYFLTDFFFFSVGSPLPDIQRPLVLLPATLLAEHGGRPHEVLRQGNHYKVITFLSSKPKSKRFCLWEPDFPGVFFVFPGLLKIKRRRRRG